MTAENVVLSKVCAPQRHWDSQPRGTAVLALLVCVLPSPPPSVFVSSFMGGGLGMQLNT